MVQLLGKAHADQQPSGGLGGLIREAVSDVGQGWGQSTGSSYCKPGLCLASGSDTHLWVSCCISIWDRDYSWPPRPRLGVSPPIMGRTVQDTAG